MRLTDRIRGAVAAMRLQEGKTLTWNSGDWVSSDSPGNRYSNYPAFPGKFAGSYLNYERLVGPLYHNSAYMACLAAYLDCFTEAPPCVKVLDENGEKVVDYEHPLTELFQMPNPEEDWNALADGMVIDLLTYGNAYLMPVFGRAGNVAELRWLPYYTIRPVRPIDEGRMPTPEEPRIIWYEYNAGSARYRLEVDQIVHLRWGVDPEMPHLGLGRGTILLREIYSDNEATNYGGALLRNFGVNPRIFSPKDTMNVFDPAELVRTVQAQSSGDRRGNAIAVDFPLDVYESQNSPEKMALDVIRRYPESRVAAVMKVPAMVAGLLAGEGTRTFSNYGEARSAFWEDSLLPLMRRIAHQVTAQLIWRQKGYERSVWFGFDYSEVRALQEDVDAMHTRARENWKAMLWTRARALREVGDEPLPEDEEVYFSAGGAQEQEDPDAEEENAEDDTEEEEGKARLLKAATSTGSRDWIERISAEIAALDADGEEKFNPNHSPTNGQFTSGRGYAGMHEATDEERAALKIPPAWTGVHVADDPTASRIAIGRDAAGRMQTRYSKAHTDEAASSKFARLKDFTEEHPQLRKKMIADMHAGREEAAALRLIDATGLRVGSDRETGARVRAYGISTLRKEHVRVDGDTVHLDFIGKEGVRNVKSVRDPALAAQMRTRLAQPGERIFATSDGKIRDYLHTIDGKFKVKDFRTWHGTAVARIAVARTPAPKTKAEYARARMEVGRVVGAHLNNKPAQALSSYIAPHVFQRWEANLGL